jgi:Macrocin-O-methyltransferase (TylF)
VSDANFKEPYFIPANSPEFLANGETWVENNQRFRQSQKFEFYRNAMDFLVSSHIAGSYFEFGTHRARTFTMVMGLDDFYASNMGVTAGGLTPKPGGGYMDKYFAFDSFEGWPEQTVEHSDPQFNAGGAKTTSDSFLELLRNYGQFTERVELIKGFYENSLTKNLATKFVKENVKASLITVDCNLYESYKSVFAWVDSFMQRGTVLYLDDLNTFRAQPDQGPKLAFKEYREQTKWKFEPFLPVGFWGYSFIVC